jgi:hypothetical protein
VVEGPSSGPKEDLMEPSDHLTDHHLREAELVRWAAQVRAARERLAQARTAQAATGISARNGGRRPARLWRFVTERTSARRPA